MKPECYERAVKAITDALTREGRVVNEQEIAEFVQNIDANLKQAQADYKAENPELAQYMSGRELANAAANSAAATIVQAGQKMKNQALQRLVVMRRWKAFIDSRGDGNFNSALEAVNAKLDQPNNGDGFSVSVDAQRRGIFNVAVGDIFPLIDFVQGSVWRQIGQHVRHMILRPDEWLSRKQLRSVQKFLGVRDLKKIDGTAANWASQQADLVGRELWGEDTGNAQAKAAAKSYSDMRERLRQRFNAAGAEVAKLQDWRLPQKWDEGLVAGSTDFVETMMPLMDRTQYLNADGTQWSDEQMIAFLTEVRHSIATNGTNKRVNGKPEERFSLRQIKRRWENDRELKFKDWKSYSQAQQMYSVGGFLDTILGDLQSMSYDIALAENFGVNAEYMFKALNEYAEYVDKEALRNIEGEAGRNLVDTATKYKEQNAALFESLMARGGATSNETMTNVAEGLRSLQVFSKLGNAVISSIPDQASLIQAARFNMVSAWDTFFNQWKTLLPRGEWANMARRSGLGIDQYIGSVSRYTDDMIGQQSASASGNFRASATRNAEAVLVLSGLNLSTRAPRQSISIMKQDWFGEMTRKYAWDEIPKAEKDNIERIGITKDDWFVLQKAKVFSLRGGSNPDMILNKDSIYQIPDEQLAGIAARLSTTPQVLKDRVATNYIGALNREAIAAIAEPSLRQQNMLMGSSARRGTFFNEFIQRNIFQFQRTPIAIQFNNFGRYARQDRRVKYLLPYLVTMTGIGAIAVQLDHLSRGEEPEDMNTSQFVLKGMAKGGGFGIYADIVGNLGIYTAAIGERPAGQNVQNAMSLIQGGTLSDVDQLISLLIATPNAMYHGEKTPGKTEARLTKFLMERSFARTWYTRAAFDHMVTQQLMNMASPRYLERVQQRNERQFHKRYWWDLGEALP